MLRSAHVRLRASRLTFFLIVPLRLLAVELILQLGQIMLQHFQTLLARTVGLLFQGSLLDLHLSDLPLQLIELGRQGIQLGLDQCTPRRPDRSPYPAGTGRKCNGVTVSPLRPAHCL